MNHSQCLDLFPDPGLPKQTEYRHFSKEFIREKVGDAELKPYVSVDSAYQFNDDTLVLYDFKQDPLLGKYHSVLIDRKQGIILSKRCSKSYLYDLLKNKLICGLAFQKEISRRLHYSQRHVISTGKRAYFSLHGYATDSTDWVALHLMSDYHPGKAAGGCVDFESVKVDEVIYTFSFDHCSDQICSWISQSLCHNDLVFRLYNYHLKHMLGWSIDRFCGREKSLLDKPEYYTPAPKVDFFTVQEVWADLQNQRHLWYGELMAEFFQLDFHKEDHQTIYRLSQRGDNIY